MKVRRTLLVRIGWARVTAGLVLVACALTTAACSSEENEGADPETDVSGNQPICEEARARVSAQCRGKAVPTFESACASHDKCRAGCIYDNPCDASAQASCFDARCR